LLFLGALLLCIESVRSENKGEESSSSHLTLLTDSDFNSKVEDGMKKPWLVIFCSSKSETCIRLKKVWLETAKILHVKVNVGLIDTAEHRGIANQYGKTRKEPFVILIKNGQYAKRSKAITNHVDLVNWGLSGAKGAKFRATPKPLGLLMLVAFRFFAVLVDVGEILLHKPASAVLLTTMGGFFGYIFGSIAAIPAATNTKPIEKAKTS